jgi:hypothetical protein
MQPLTRRYTGQKFRCASLPQVSLFVRYREIFDIDQRTKRRKKNEESPLPKIMGQECITTLIFLYEI